MRTYVRVREAEILHADLDAFFASVEQRDDPRLRGRPVIVAIGVVIAASYEAKAYGIHSAMGGRQARRLCPQAVVVAPRMSAYAEASKAVFEVFERTSPLVEGLSIDEAFLDVRGMLRLAGPPVDIAVRLRHDVREQVGLPITVGVARTKFLAKVASGVAKPDGLLVVHPDGELAFLHPLPVERLWGVGRVTAGKLHGRGITTVGQVAELAETTLVAMLGRASGRQLHALAHNRDPRPVQVGRRRRSIGSQRALGRTPKSPDALEAIVIALVEQTQVILATARWLLWTAMPMIERRGVTLVGLALAGLDDDDAVQLGLPFGRYRAAGLDAALDEIRDRHGSAAVTRAVLLGRDQGLSMPLLPD